MSTPNSAPASLVAHTFEGNARFELRRILGEGGMGVVYEAFDRERQMAVALKTVRDLDAQTLYRLKTEFRARADLEHRNLIRLGELHEDGGHWFFSMELVDGESFLDWVRPEGALHEARLRDTVRQLALGLEALHRANKVHRDLKPSNVLVTRKGRVVVLDFGLVGEARGHIPSDQSVIGTAPYMAPEQALSPMVTAAADVYSAGAMIYEALTGRLPHEGRPLEILMRKQRELPPPPHTIATVPADLSALAMEMLAIDAARRPTASAVLARVSSRALPVEDRPVPFVGRAPELSALDEVLDEVSAGATRTVFVEGESGIGKSALVRAFVERIEARRPDARVLAGRCYERESVPFKGIDGVVDALARDLMRRDPLDVALLLTPEVEALARVFPVLRRVPAIARMSVPRPASPIELRARAFRGLRLLLGALAAKHTLVVVIDDIQWADTDSLTLLREILHAPGAPWLMLVLTRRDVGAAPALPGAARTIALDRLSAAEGRALIELLAPQRAAEADVLIDEAGGHPMFLQEVVRHAAGRATRFDDALWGRVTRMEDGARRVLELVAVAGAPVPQGVVGNALGLDARGLSKAIDVLRSTWLVRTGGTRGSDPIEPYHDRVRDAVLARIPLARRRRHHGRLAAALFSSDVAEKDPLVLVRHLEAAGQHERAAELAERAAERAAEALAFELAAELWSAALRMGTSADEDRRRDLLSRRAEALGMAGRGAEAAAVYLDAADGADPQTAFQCRRAAAHELLVSGHVPQGLQLLDEVLDAVGRPRPRSVGAAKRALAWQWLLTLLRGTRFRERHTLDAPPIDQLRLDLYRSASLGLGMVDLLHGAIFQARSVLVALRVGDQRRVAYAVAYHAMYLGSSGIRVPWARRLIARAQELAAETRSPFLLGWARCAEGIVEFFAGNHVLAIEILEEAEEALRDRSVGVSAELNHLRVFITFALRRTGAYDVLKDKQTEYLRDALRRGDRYAASAFQWASNVVWVAADETAHARDDLAPEFWSPPAEGLHLQHWFRQRGLLELALYEDDRAALPALGAAIEPFLGPAFAHVQAVATETRYLLARIAIVQGDAAGARRAVRALRRTRAPYIRAFVQLVLAAADALDGKRAAARGHLADAITDAEACGMLTIAALARRRLGELVGEATMVHDADAVLTTRGVKRPDRFARVFATWPETD